MKADTLIEVSVDFFQLFLLRVIHIFLSPDLLSSEPLCDHSNMNDTPPQLGELSRNGIQSDCEPLNSTHMPIVPSMKIYRLRRDRKRELNQNDASINDDEWINSKFKNLCVPSRPVCSKSNDSSIDRPLLPILIDTERSASSERRGEDADAFTFSDSKPSCNGSRPSVRKFRSDNNRDDYHNGHCTDVSSPVLTMDDPGPAFCCRRRQPCIMQSQKGFKPKRSEHRRTSIPSCQRISRSSDSLRFPGHDICVSGNDTCANRNRLANPLECQLLNRSYDPHNRLKSFDEAKATAQYSIRKSPRTLNDCSNITHSPSSSSLSNTVFRNSVFNSIVHPMARPSDSPNPRRPDTPNTHDESLISDQSPDTSSNDHRFSSTLEKVLRVSAAGVALGISIKVRQVVEYYDNHEIGHTIMG